MFVHASFRLVRLLCQWRSSGVSRCTLLFRLLTHEPIANAQRWSASFDLTGSWPAHSGIVLSSIVTRLKVPRADEPAGGETGNDASKEHDRFVLVTGGNDDQIKVRQSHGLSRCSKPLILFARFGRSAHRNPHHI